ncbi:NAD(P)H-quinone oxidoreductase subunit K, chloroplastic [subsurface metagenome]|jgi:F420-non-reducing hydrogenase small subunit|uniref:NADH:ubiquinone oxidoreductase-like 20kDa subunit domain-containing protein n=1 Tax=marine sediment metagenome TaxID=412755 RepID=X1AHJ1_9ZZZZ
MPVKVAEEWLNICGGCEITILDIGEPLLDLLPKLEFVHMPVLMDHKYFGQTGEKTELEIPEADIGIISGGIRNEKEKHVAEEMRKKCKTLISLGSCACFGGIPALANQYPLIDLYDKVYRQLKTTDSADTPAEDIPPLTDRVYALDEVVKVDVYIPGCPTSPELIANALTSLLEGKPFEIPERSVCDDCPVKREKKAITSIKRPLESIVPPGQKLEDSRCFMELGYLCLGPVTKSGCGGSEKTPRCIKAFMPCRGCFGPIRAGANPMVEMMGALSSIGLDPKLILDRRSTFQRYIGAQGRLRPLPKRP